MRLEGINASNPNVAFQYGADGANTALVVAYIAPQLLVVVESYYYDVAIPSGVCVIDSARAARRGCLRTLV
jgi:hypothetical protein